MSDDSALIALGSMLSTVLGSGFDDVNTMPQAMQRLSKVRPPVLQLVCGNCKRPGAGVGEVHAIRGRFLKFWYVRRTSPSDLWKALPSASPEMRRVANFVYWMDETPGMDGVCSRCGRRHRTPNDRLLGAIHNRRTHLLV